MKSHVGKSNEEKNTIAANSFSGTQHGNRPSPLFIDNRFAAVAQRNLIDAIDTSPKQTAQRQQLKAQFDSTAQLQPVAEYGPLQGAFDTMPHQLKPEAKPNNTGLPDNLKAGVENLSGYPMDDVKVHYNSDKPSQLQAHAYAQGTDIHLASGQEQHLPHEAWHVVQQKQGRVKSTMQLKQGVPVNDDAGLEKEADVMGAKAAAQLTPESVGGDPVGFERLQNKDAVKTVQRQADSLSPIELSTLQNAGDAEIDEIVQEPEVAAELEKLLANPEIEAKLQAVFMGSDQKGGHDNAEHENGGLVLPSPEEEAKAHGMSLDEARASGVVQRQNRPVRAAAATARYLISTMITTGSHGGWYVRRNHQSVVQVIGGNNYQYTTSGQGCIDFENNESDGGDPVSNTQDIQPYFAAHGWSLRNFSRYYHFKAANALRQGLAANSNTMPNDGGSSPAGQTWHHDEPVGDMDLVLRPVHSAFRHRGGFSIWGS